MNQNQIKHLEHRIRQTINTKLDALPSTRGVPYVDEHKLQKEFAFKDPKKYVECEIAKKHKEIATIRAALSARTKKIKIIRDRYRKAQKTLNTEADKIRDSLYLGDQAGVLKALEKFTKIKV